MPRTEVVFYCDDDGPAPVLEWLAGLSLKARLKCLERIERLKELGHELRRPEADYLRDGIYELRVSLNHVQYRLLYAFHTEKEADRDERTRSVRKSSRKARPAGRGDGRSGGPTFRRTIALIAHGITKEGAVPDTEIDRTLVRMKEFLASPDRHTYQEG